MWGTDGAVLGFPLSQKGSPHHLSALLLPEPLICCRRCQSYLFCVQKEEEASSWSTTPKYFRPLYFKSVL